MLVSGCVTWACSLTGTSPSKVQTSNRIAQKLGDYDRDDAELSRLQQLTAQHHRFWTPRQLAYLNATKECVLGGAEALPKKNVAPPPCTDTGCPACGWDCARRATMLEPLVADVLHHGVPGDFLEAGVFKGGVSIYLAAMVRARGELGEQAEHSHKRRRMWLADSFEGLPSPVTYTSDLANRGLKRTQGPTTDAGTGSTEPLTSIRSSVRSDWTFAKMWKKGDFGSSLEEVKGNVRRCLLPVSQLHHAPPDAMASDGTGGMSHGKAGGVKAEASAMPKGVQFLQGYFSKTLPGPVKRLAFLRADSDMYASIYETLHALYPLLSPGGYVVFDDWKFVQARGAINDYRQNHNITSQIMSSDAIGLPPFFVSLDRMAFWQKSDATG